MNSRPVGIGIIGCGSVARIHAKALNLAPELRLAAVYSEPQETAESFAVDFGVPAHGSLDAFLSDKSLQAVAICTPSGTHSELGCAAAKAGKHVLVEKPIDVTLSKADDLIGTCRQHNVQLGVSFQSRFLEAPGILKSALDSGRLGKPVMAGAHIKWHRTAEYYASAGWRGTLKMDGGGVLINQAIHTVDLLRWIMGPVAEVSAFSGRLLHPGIEGEDTLVASLRFNNGALGIIEAATSVYPGFKRRLEISGTEGTAILDGDSVTTWALRDGSPNPAPPAGDVSDGSADPMAIDCEGHRRVLVDFAEAIREGRKPRVDGHAGRESLELVLAIYNSAQKGGQIWKL